MGEEGRASQLADSATAPTSPAGSSSRKAAPRRPGIIAIFPRNFDEAATVWAVRGRAVIGRGRESDIQLLDTAVSRRHAQLASIESGLRVADLGSQHGTFLDGQAVGSADSIAAYGSVLRVGNSLFLVCEDVDAYKNPMRRIAAEYLGLRNDVIAGPELCGVWQQAAHVAALPHPVLIQGETGSGKEAAARLVHAMRDPPGPFVAVNLAAISENLLESELFGHLRGSFTGATAARTGVFCQASGGVLFLDEVADLRSDLQVKLLRTIDQMRVRPVGADHEVAIETRVVAATSQDLRKACADGRFRSDLYYRLSGIVLHVPPLRERRADILPLALAFLKKHHPQLCLSALAAEALALCAWRGNVRELFHALAQAAMNAVSAASDEVLEVHLPELETFERAESLTPEGIVAAVATSNGNASAAAKALGVSRSTLYNVLKRQGIDPGTLRGRK